MRIVSLTTAVATVDTPRAPVGNLIFRLQTDAGVTGTSYVWTWSEAVAMLQAAVRYLEPSVIGRRALDYEALYADVYERTLTVQLAGGPLAVAHAGIDMAMWDAVCKALGEPLHRVLGGRSDRSPAYRTLFGREDALTLARAALADGFRAVKAPIAIDPARPEPGLEQLQALREALPADVGMRLDGASWWLSGASVEHVFRLCRALDDFGLDWIEDPLAPSEVEQLARLRAQLRTPVATGENLYDRRVFRALFEKRAVDVAIVDLMRVGGITGALKVAREAEAFGISVATHGMGELGAQLIPALPNGLVVEHLAEISLGLMESELRPQDGLAVADPRPGIGVHFDAERVARAAA